MKRAAILALLCIASLRAANYHPETMEVYQIDRETVTLEARDGNLYDIETLDYTRGDLVRVWIDDQGTPDRRDDAIIYHRYAGHCGMED